MRTRKRMEMHGGRNTPEYRVWIDMKRRCYNPERNEYKYYGGKGVTVCDRWLESFTNFIADMGARPSDGYQIDRIDTYGNYCPENCRWVTAKTNSNNKRNNLVLTLNGRSMTASQWARELNMFKMTLVKRKNRGWSDEEVLTRPLKNMGRTWSGKHQ